VNVLGRVFYLEFPVTIPAGGSTSVTADLQKSSSFDFACSGSENVGVQGYGMVTRLGSNLSFEEQTAEVTNTKCIEIVRQNFGFDLPGNVTSVTLDPAMEHYYLEIRAVERSEFRNKCNAFIALQNIFVSNPYASWISVECYFGHRMQGILSDYPSVSDICYSSVFLIVSPALSSRKWCFGCSRLAQ